MRFEAADNGFCRTVLRIQWTEYVNKNGVLEEVEQKDICTYQEGTVEIFMAYNVKRRLEILMRTGQIEGMKEENKHKLHSK